MKRIERHNNCRSGFSLPDLVAILVLAAVGGGTLLPAIERAREATRKEDCANRLREIAFATHIFHSVNERLPSVLGHVGSIENFDFPSTVNNYRHTSALAQVAPFMGLSNLFDDADPLILDFDFRLLENGYTSTGNFWFSGDSPNLSVVQNVSEFVCPSDNINELEANALNTHSVHFQGAAGLGRVAWIPTNPNDPDPLPRARSNYTACAGASAGGLNILGTEFGNYSGAIGWREQINMLALPDGLSNTVMFGENIGTIQISEDGLFQRDFTTFWFMGGSARMQGNIGWMEDPPYDTRTGDVGFFSIFNADTPDFPDPDIDPDPSQSLLGHANYARTQGFGSMHPAGVNFVFLDGSIRTVGRTDDWQSLYAIGGAYDGAIDFELSRPGKRR